MSSLPKSARPTSRAADATRRGKRFGRKPERPTERRHQKAYCDDPPAFVTSGGFGDGFFTKAIQALSPRSFSIVIPGPVPGIHVLLVRDDKDVDVLHHAAPIEPTRAPSY